MWRCGLRLGESVAGHGPDADALSDGDRDWTVPLATAVFSATYLVVAVLTLVLAGTRDFTVQGRVLGWSLVLTAVVGGTAIATGSGRLAVLLGSPSVRATAHAVASVLLTFLAGAFLVFLIAFAVDFGAAMNVLSRLHTDTGDAVLFSLLVLTLVPNAVVFAGAYLLGPGFAVGTEHPPLADRGRRRTGADVPAARRPPGQRADSRVTPALLALPSCSPR